MLKHWWAQEILFIDLRDLPVDLSPQIEKPAGAKVVLIAENLTPHLSWQATPLQHHVLTQPGQTHFMEYEIQISSEVKLKHVTYCILKQLHKTKEQEVQATLDHSVIEEFKSP